MEREEQGKKHFNQKFWHVPSNNQYSFFMTIVLVVGANQEKKKKKLYLIDLVVKIYFNIYASV